MAVIGRRRRRRRDDEDVDVRAMMTTTEKEEEAGDHHRAMMESGSSAARFANADGQHSGGVLFFCEKQLCFAPIRKNQLKIETWIKKVKKKD